jgi:hypothetical protein
MGENEVGPSGLLASGFRGLNEGPLNGGLGLQARAGALFVPANDDRRHLGAAKGDGLRKRSAGTAAEMLMRNGHGNAANMHKAFCAPSNNFQRT